MNVSRTCFGVLRVRDGMYLVRYLDMSFSGDKSEKSVIVRRFENISLETPIG